MGNAGENLAGVVLEHAIMTDFCGIPLASLRENRITELDLQGKGIGEPGALVLSKLLPSAVALKLLKCAAATQSVCICSSLLTALFDISDVSSSQIRPLLAQFE